MTKHTSKSAFGTPKTSSPSGTSGLTDGTGSKPKKRRKSLGKFGAVVTRIQTQSSSAFRESLIAAGIIGDDGKLTKKYKQK